MRQLIVNLSDAQMRALEEVAKSRDMRPENLVSEQLASITTRSHGPVGVSIKRYARFVQTRKDNAYSLNPLVPPGTQVRQPAVVYHVGIRNPAAVQMVGNVPATGQSPQLEPNSDRALADVERSRRREILKGTSGIWKDRRDTPKDGLQYQLEARAEWD